MAHFTVREEKITHAVYQQDVLCDQGNNFVENESPQNNKKTTPYTNLERISCEDCYKKAVKYIEGEAGE